MEKQLAKAKDDYNEELSKARKEANAIIDKDGKTADEKRKEMIALAKKEVDDYMQQEKAALNLQKTEMISEVKKEAAGLIATALEKILGQKANPKQDQEMIERTLEEIKK
jgi:F-type H+-transporting ATPase subunit b